MIFNEVETKDLCKVRYSSTYQTKVFYFVAFKFSELPDHKIVLEE
jgi:hypothetical protein